jgi:hypothetical protein
VAAVVSAANGYIPNTPHLYKNTLRVLAQYYEEVSGGFTSRGVLFYHVLFLYLLHLLSNYIYFPFGLELLS